MIRKYSDKRRNSLDNDRVLSLSRWQIKRRTEMEFKKLYEKYKWGQVTKEEKEFVEKEMAARGLTKEDLDRGIESEKDVQLHSDSNNNEVELINTKTNFAVMHMIVTAAMAVMIVIIVGVYFVKISPAIKQADKYKAEKEAMKSDTYDNKDWDIMTHSFFSEKSDAQLAYETFYHLHMQGDEPMTFQIHCPVNENKGQYFYSITDYSVEAAVITGITNKKKMTVGSPSYQGDYFRTWDSRNTSKNLKKSLEELDSNTLYKICINFDKSLDEDKILKLLNSEANKTNVISWVHIATPIVTDTGDVPLLGIYTAMDNSNVEEYTGNTWKGLYEDDGLSEEDVSVYTSGSYFYNGTKFFLYGMNDWYEDNFAFDTDILKSYLIERIAFMESHPEALSFINQKELLKSDYYKSAREYIENNKLTSYGICVRGLKEEIQRLCKDISGDITYINKIESY